MAGVTPALWKSREIPVLEPDPGRTLTGSRHHRKRRREPSHTTNGGGIITFSGGMRVVGGIRMLFEQLVVSSGNWKFVSTRDYRDQARPDRTL